jgi:hypothetical protein
MVGSDYGQCFVGDRLVVFLVKACNCPHLDTDGVGFDNHIVFKTEYVPNLSGHLSLQERQRHLANETSLEQ